MYKGFVISPKKIQEYVFEGKVSRIIQQILEVNIKLTRTVAPPGGLPYITDRDARRNFQKKPLKVTILGVAPANFIP